MRKTGRAIKTRREKVPTADSVRIQQLTDWCEEEWISVICETLHSEHSGVASCSARVSVCLCPCPCVCMQCLCPCLCVCMQCPCPCTRRYLCMREFGRRLLASSEPYLHTPPTYHWAPPPLYSPIISMLNL